MRENQFELLVSQLVQQTFQGLEADFRLLAFVKQNDGPRLKRFHDAMHNFRAIVDLCIKRSGVPSYQVQSSCGEDRVEEGIFQSGGCAEPERDRSAYRGDCGLKFVDFLCERFWVETPEREFWMRLRMVSNAMTGFQNHSG
jgi:hypothetical protein